MNELQLKAFYKDTGYICQITDTTGKPIQHFQIDAPECNHPTWYKQMTAALSFIGQSKSFPGDKGTWRMTTTVGFVLDELRLWDEWKKLPNETPDEITSYPDTWKGIPMIQTKDIWEFFKLIGWDHQKRVWLEPHDTAVL